VVITGQKYKLTFTTKDGGVDEWMIEAKSVIYGNGVKYTLKLEEAVTKGFHLVDWFEKMTQTNVNPKFVQQNPAAITIEGDNTFIEQPVVYPASFNLVEGDYIITLVR
jgi:5-hydroxyisourate hydrolase-like protein (transthyretin family)